MNFKQKIKLITFKLVYGFPKLDSETKEKKIPKVKVKLKSLNK